ncbi:hypothetical protein [Microbulbifer taiwanensis]|uniref:Transmembrane protein n=1 Tax=Microbulbifer taiwanensis TaxID=986746 RepID=A0ABW1YQS0_9GAMM|nr:hypothetical protein [Microbulbifer taiwanensis]
MNQSSHNTATESAGAKPPGLGGIQGISVIASVLLPILAAYVVYYTGLGMPRDTTNQGELLQTPVNISQLEFTGEGELPLQLGAEKPKWRFLILPADNCDSECEKLLYTSRQVHIRLGEKADRVERLLVTATPLGAELQQKLQSEHPRLRIVQLPAGALQELKAQTLQGTIAESRALLIDQQGYAMMAYDNQHSGNQLLKDVKRLLKYSYER